MRNRAIRGVSGITAVALATVIGVVGAPQQAEATTTRVYTLGAMNRFVLDDTNRWLYPHIISKYGNLFYLELFGSGPSAGTSAPGSNRGSAANGSIDLAETMPVQQTAGGGMILGLTDDLFMSMHLSDYEDGTVPRMLNWLAATSGNDPSGFPWLPNPPDAPGSANRKFDVFFAYNLQDIAQLGLQLSYGSSSYNRSPNDNDPEIPTNIPQDSAERRFSDSIGTSAFSFLLSGGAAIGEFANVDAALGMTFHGLTYRPNDRGGLIEGGGGVELQGDVRAMIGLSDQWELIPAMSLRSRSLSAADLANYANGLRYDNSETGREDYFITDATLSDFVFDLGVAGHFKPADGIHFWMATGFEVISSKQSFENRIPESPDNGNVRTDQNLEFFRTTDSASTVPYFRLALEARILSWLDLRGGVVKYMRGLKVTEDQEDINNTDFNRLNSVSRDEPFFDYFVGFAVHHEGFFLDLQVDPLWFQRGPELLSGASGSGGGNMFVNTSLGYRF